MSLDHDEFLTLGRIMRGFKGAILHKFTLYDNREMVVVSEGIEAMGWVLRHLKVGKVKRTGQRGMRRITISAMPPSQGYKRSVKIKPNLRRTNKGGPR